MAIQAAFLGCGLTLIGIVIATAGIIGLQPALRSLHWPATQGEVITSEITRQAGQTRARVRYRYSIDDKTFTGGHIAYHGSRSLPGLPAVTAEAIVRRYPPGSAVSVYYNPLDPVRAVLEPGAGAAITLPLVAGGLFFIVGLILSLMALLS
jgi:hypothetical protein